MFINSVFLVNSFCFYYYYFKLLSSSRAVWPLNDPKPSIFFFFRCVVQTTEHFIFICAVINKKMKEQLWQIRIIFNFPLTYWINLTSFLNGQFIFTKRIDVIFLASFQFKITRKRNFKIVGTDMGHHRNCTFFLLSIYVLLVEFSRKYYVMFVF